MLKIQINPQTTKYYWIGLRIQTMCLYGYSEGFFSGLRGGREGMDQHGELAVVEQVQRAEQLTADRDRLFLIGLTSVKIVKQWGVIGSEVVT